MKINGQEFRQVSPEYVHKLKKLEKFIDPLTKLIEMKQQNERAGLGLAASPSGETECKMDSLRSIVKGDQIVQYSVLERVERLLEERFGNELVDHFIPEHFIPFAKKPVRDLTEMEMSQIRGEVVSLINYYASMEDKIKDLTTLLHLLNKSTPHQLEQNH